MPRAKQTDEAVVVNTATFSPEVIMASDKFKQYADLIAAVIEDREYSIEEVEQLIQDTLNKPIVETIND